MKKINVKSQIGKCTLLLMKSITLFLFIFIGQVSIASATEVLFDFDNAPNYTSLPISQTVGGITARFSATGQGYSIQNANVLGFVPQGFAGRIISPNSINLSDLLIRFDQNLSDFSIMYSCQELGCDDAATMRVTAFKNGSLVGTNTKTASFPGTWPVDTLRCSFPMGFDSVVVHYDSRPPTCKDYGVIFMADNMRVTTVSSSSVSNQDKLIEGLTIPNPITQSVNISFSLFRNENVKMAIYDMKGILIKNLFDGISDTGEFQINWDVNNDEVINGVYYLKITGMSFTQTFKLVVVK